MDKSDPPKRIWKEVIDPSSRSTYYWNVLTGETTWENPVPDDPPPLPFHERVSHDTKVIIDKLDHKVDRIKFFFDEIDLISNVCDYLRSEDIGSLKELIESSLANIDQILDVATPQTKSYNKFLDIKKFLAEQKSYLKNNNDISEDMYDRIKDVSEEVERHLENFKRFEVSNDNLLDGYKTYIEKRKLEPVEHPDSAKQEHPKSPEDANSPKKQSNNPKLSKKNKLRSIHERWTRASEIIDKSEDDDFNPETDNSSFNFVNTDKDNPNLVPIPKPWYEKDN